MKFEHHNLFARVIQFCFLASLCCMCCFLGCVKKSGKDSGVAGVTIQIKGSDTMVNIAQAWAEAYRLVDPHVNIEISGGGSGVGIAALEKGTIDIATASRNIKKEEFERTLQNTGKEPVDFTVGFDALAIFVHKSNPLCDITIDQLAGIFGETGEMLRWSQLGVTIPGIKKDNLVLISRQSSSGTYSFFREKVLHKKDFKLGTLDMNGSKEVVELISHTKPSLGYSGMGYATEGVKMLNLAAHDGDTAYAPTVENTVAQKYPLARSLHMYTLGEPSGATKEFLAWIVSEFGQKILEENGFVPVTSIN